MASEPDVSTIVPPNRSTIRHRLPSTGSRGLVPPPQRYYSVLRLPAAHPAALRCLRLAVPRWARCSLPGEGEPACRGPGLGHPVTHPGHHAETTGPPGFLGSPHAHMPRSSTATEGEAPRPNGASPAAFRALNGVGLRIDPSYAALSRGLCAPCARFAAPVTRRHATPGSRCWLDVAGRDSHPPGSEKKFPA